MSLDSGEKEMILSFIFEGANNLELALKVHEVYDDIRKEILLKFFNGLEEKLREHLPADWEVVNEIKQEVYDRYKGISLAKTTWEDKYYIEICPEKYNARDFWIGIYKDKVLKPIEPGKLKRILDDNFKQGSQNEEYEWWQWLDQPYRDFKDIKLLVDTYNSHETETVIFNQLITLKDLSEKLIDDALEKSK